MRVVQAGIERSGTRPYQDGASESTTETEPY